MMGKAYKFAISAIQKALKSVAFILTVVLLSFKVGYSQNKEITLDMSDPQLWTVDVVHLGSKQIDISYDEKANNELFYRHNFNIASKINKQ
jgi:predicted secreted protein